MNVEQQSKQNVTVVVGGSGAIGCKIVDRLCQDGKDVIVLDRAPCPNPTATFLETDITSAASVQASFNQMQTLNLHPTQLVVASGILRPAPFLELKEADIQAHLDVNLLGAFRVAQLAAKAMQSTGGRIVFITSIHGQIGVPDRAAYAMSKAAISAMVRAMAVELSSCNIRVNALAPGAIDGGMSPTEGTRQHWRGQTPSKRVALMDEVVNATLMLLSDEASFLSGQTIALDGGVSTSRVLA